MHCGSFKKYPHLSDAEPDFGSGFVCVWTVWEVVRLELDVVAWDLGMMSFGWVGRLRSVGLDVRLGGVPSWCGVMHCV